MSFQCSTCGEIHDEFPAWGVPLPESAGAIAMAERASRLIFDSDICEMDKKRLFVLGRIEIPIIGQEDPFCYLAWVELPEAHHHFWFDVFNLERRSHFDPIDGILDSRLPGLESCLGAEVVLCLRDNLQRPKIRSAFVKGALADLQRKGITFEKACELNHQCNESG